MTNNNEDNTEIEEVETITDEEMQVVTEDIRRQLQAKQIGVMLISGKTYKEIADALGVHRNSLYAILRNEQMIPLLVSEVTAMESKLQDWINDLSDSKSPANKRHATSELGKMVRHSKDKLDKTIFSPTYTGTGGTNPEWEENCLMFEQLVYSTLTRMPTPMRTLFWGKWMEVKQENGWENIQAPYDALPDTHPRKQLNRRHT